MGSSISAMRQILMRCVRVALRHYLVVVLSARPTVARSTSRYLTSVNLGRELLKFDTVWHRGLGNCGFKLFMGLNCIPGRGDYSVSCTLNAPFQ